MLRLAVCDDDEFVIEQIESYIEKLKEIIFSTLKGL